MVNFIHTVLGLLILQIYVNAAPSNITSVEELISKEVEPSTKAVDPISKVEGPIKKAVDPFSKEDEPISIGLDPISKEEEPILKYVDPISKIEEPLEDVKIKEPAEVNSEEAKLDSQQLFIEDSKLHDNSRQSLRQKRFYNFYGYGVPPINSVVYPGYNKRDQSAETGVYGSPYTSVVDPLEQIQRRLHDIVNFARQPAPPPPPPSHFPFFFPVIYIPQFACDCSSGGTTTPPPQPENPQTPRPVNNQTDPDPDKRFPDLSDERQNWGFVTNETDPEYDENEFSRPISFDPIEPIRPLERPSPPVDHGSSQGDSAQTTTTVKPTNASRRPPPSQSRPQNSQGRPQQSAPYPPSFGNDIPRNEQPSTCDGAVLSCCHQPYVTYDCFLAQGCPDLTSYGNPCDSLVILQVIEKFQKFYGVRNEK